MVLGENYKRRLMELAGISPVKSLVTEADNRNVIIQKLKLPKEIADWAHNLSSKYSIWIADSLKKEILDSHLNSSGFIGGKTLVQDIMALPSFASIEKKPENSMYLARIKDIEKLTKEKEGKYKFVLDWLKGRNTLAPEHDQINFKTLTLSDAQKRSEEWHKSLAAIQGGKIQGEEGEVVMTFPEGFYWIKIGKDYCPKEAEAMGHCGRASGTVLYSLRREQYPYVTAAIKEETGAVTQMKGRANTKPKASFHKYIIPFILRNNPDIKYFKSSHAAHTDFNINDLSDGELKQVVNKKPSLLMWDGEIALKRLSEQEIQKLLIEHPEVFTGWTELITLSDILKNNDMINWAIVNAPELFHKYKFGNLKLSKDQLFKALSNDSISANLKIDDMGLDDEAIDWIIKNKPQMFEDSIINIQKLTDEQKDYLVKNHPLAFLGFLGLIAVEERKLDDKILSFFGAERLQYLFEKHPELFARPVRIGNYKLWQNIITPELMDKYIRERNVSNDPLKILSNSKKLYYFHSFINNDTAMFILVHYPDLFFSSELIGYKVNEEGGEVMGRYIIDHHFDWVEKYQSKLKIQDWNLTETQKQKIINYDKKEGTITFVNYGFNEADYRKFDFTLAQKKQLLKIYKENGNLNLDMILGFDFIPDSVKGYVLNVLENNEDESKNLVSQIEESYGAEYVNALYKENPDAFLGLLEAVKYKDVDRLSKYNNSDISYEKDGIKIRFDDWSDEDLIDLFKDSREGGRDLAKQVANWELDFNGYDYEFGDIDNNFDDLDQVNTAKVKYLLTKAFPVKYKKEIQAMSHSQLVDILNDPDSISEDAVKIDDDIIDGIKEAFTFAIEDAQRNADEDEYWKLYVNPIKETLGEPKFVNAKVRKKGEKELVNTQVLEFQISYGQLEDFIKNANDNSDSFSDNELISIKDYANSLKSIIKAGIEDEGLEINTPYNGVSGDIEKESVNERFGERLHDHSELSTILDKAKITVKRQPKKAAV